MKPVSNKLLVGLFLRTPIDMLDYLTDKLFGIKQAGVYAMWVNLIIVGLVVILIHILDRFGIWWS